MASERRPVYLTARQQDLIAELAHRLRGVAYDMTRGHEHWPEAADVGEKVVTAFDLYGVQAQELDTIYDVMHRSGENL